MTNLIEGLKIKKHPEDIRDIIRYYRDRNEESLRTAVHTDHAACSELADILLNLLTDGQKRGQFYDSWAWNVVRVMVAKIVDEKATKKEYPNCILCSTCGSPINCYTCAEPNVRVPGTKGEQHDKRQKA